MLNARFWAFFFLVVVVSVVCVIYSNLLGVIFFDLSLYGWFIPLFSGSFLLVYLFIFFFNRLLVYH